ncbi:MAG TPA: hypothetical protein VFU11_06930 [Solirubrobacterales bacterium]|nr:hypothetical protein [Solirubrobacterales bacterium]
MGLQTWNITTGDVTLQASINPHGLETTVQFFLYLPCPENHPGRVARQGVSVLPLAERTIPAGQGSVRVSAQARDDGIDLEPGSRYGWTVKAENSAGALFAEEESFLTGRRPSILKQSASGITETDATLNAEITPGVQGNDWGWDGVGSYYQFQLAEDPADFRPELGCPDLSEWEGSSVGCLGPLLPSTLYGWPPAAGSFAYQPTDLPFSFVDALPSQSISLNLSEIGRTLEPETTYYYRVIAVTRLQGVDKIEWEAPPVYGATQTFATPPYPPPPAPDAVVAPTVLVSSPIADAVRGGVHTAIPREARTRCSKRSRGKQAKTSKAKRQRTCKVAIQLGHPAETTLSQG